jgi:hypothetical protein
MLNSSIINGKIKPLQPKGLFGERTIHRRPFMLPIPKFDANSLINQRLAELSKRCHNKVTSLRFTKRSVAGLRKEAREALKKELEEIDNIVKCILI